MTSSTAAIATAAVAPARQLTDEQHRALASRQVSVALSAGAGCGKTFVLTERFLAQFDPSDPGGLQPQDIGHLVAITFTRAAAREMRDRVRRACYTRLRGGNATDAGFWSAMIRSLDSARISTIDSFCGSLLRSHAVEAGLDPRFSQLAPEQSASLLAELLDDVLREGLSRRDEQVLDLAVRYGLETLREKLRQLCAHHDAAEMAAWKDRSSAELVQLWADFHREQVLPGLMRRIVRSDAGSKLSSFLSAVVVQDATVQAQRAAIVEVLDAWRAGHTLAGDASADLAALLENARMKKRAQAWPSPEDYATFKDACEALRRMIDRCKHGFAFDAAAAVPAAEAGLQILAVAHRVVERYESAKRDAATLDFRDLLSQAHRLLTSPEHEALRQRVSAQIQMLLVDEFQDTDPLQVELIAALCGDAIKAGKLFFVGDHKQSIYRFRGADPQVFRNLRQQLPAAGRMPLTLNFRSEPAVLHFVNALFAESLGADYEALRAHRPQTTPLPAVEFLWALPAEPPAAKEAVDVIRRREADWIGRRLRGLIETQTPLIPAIDGNGAPALRPVQPGDIAILFRALSDVAHYEEALRRYGLDYYLVGGNAFYAQQEIYDLTNLLRAVADPADVVSLAGVLRSPFFSLADETLFWLAQHPGGLADGLFAGTFPKELVDEQRRAAVFAAKTLAALRAAKDRVSIVELIHMALARTGYDALLLAEFLGERKLANLGKLIDTARHFERGGMFRLPDFIAELSEHIAEQPREALAATHAADTNVVRLMSIHQSKGLEFPIVVVADIDRQVQGRPSGIEFSRQLGPLVNLPAEEDAGLAVTGYDLFQLAAAEEDAAEVNRLLYVATTRAADLLILSAGLTSLDKTRGPWIDLLAKRFDLATGSCLGAAIAADEIPRVRVTTERPACGHAEGPARRPEWPLLIEQARQLAATAGESDRLLSLVDPVPPANRERRQFSFSRLSGALKLPAAAVTGATDDGIDAIIDNATDGDVDAAADAQSRATDPRGLGTLVHAVLAEVRGPAWPTDVAAVVRRHEHLAPAGGDDSRQAATLVERFLRSPRANELATARQDLCEIEFLLAWPPRVSTESDGAGYRLTGFIDRLYQDADGGWHILDFKTNQVHAATLATVARRYELQMFIYALAVERSLGSAPKSQTLHLLRTGDEYPFVWTAAARQRLTVQIDAAIAALGLKPDV